ncbi:MotB family protein [Onishia niordana]|uniref:MotB family protein n=1 Tax=Onishia niordana TaxID=2508711 RepID=UPI00109FCF77|nr:MotB family protein [Halomonas niordiana]
MDEIPKRKKASVPGWVVTFADLMSLLMCFFVLLLSFAEIDAQRFERLAGELAQAFGVQRDIPASQIPMGTSPVLQNFSPGRPTPTPTDKIQQSTTVQERHLVAGQSREGVDSDQVNQVRQVAEKVQALLEGSETQERMLVQTERQRIVIRIDEKGTFASGSARVLPPFRELLAEMATVFVGLPGIVSVDGHTDSVPVSGSRYDSNWGLSAARASSVAGALLESSSLEPDRLMVRGFAATRPLDTRETPDAYARNRRVEITIDLSEPSKIHRETGLDSLSGDV